MRKIKTFFRENKLTAGLYKKLYRLKHLKAYRQKEKRRRTVQKNGVKLIHFIQDALQGEFFFFDMGTLLGIIREGRLLGHDLDVDLGVILDGEKSIQRIRSLLISAGCEHVRSFTIDEIGVVEDSFSYHEIRFDVGYYRQSETQSIIYLMYIDPERALESGNYRVVELATSKIDSLETVSFGGKMINIPANSEAYLAERYGESWRIPDKGYVYWKGPSTKPTDFIAKQTIGK